MSVLSYPYYAYYCLKTPNGKQELKDILVNIDLLVSPSRPLDHPSYMNYARKTINEKLREKHGKDNYTIIEIKTKCKYIKLDEYKQLHPNACNKQDPTDEEEEKAIISMSGNPPP